MTRPVTYVVQKSIGIRITSVALFESVLTGLLTNGVNYVHGIEFRTSELRKHRDAAGCKNERGAARQTAIASNSV